MTVRGADVRHARRGAAADRDTSDPPALQRAEWGQMGGGSRAEEAASFVARLASRVEPGTRLGTKEELRVRCAVSVGTSGPCGRRELEKEKAHATLPAGSWGR